MDDVVLPMLAGTMSPSDVAKLVADDTASMADAGILFPADSDGTLWHLTLPEYCFRPFLLGFCSRHALLALLG